MEEQATEKYYYFCSYYVTQNGQWGFGDAPLESDEGEFPIAAMQQMMQAQLQCNITILNWKSLSKKQYDALVAARHAAQAARAEAERAERAGLVLAEKKLEIPNQ